MAQGPSEALDLHGQPLVCRPGDVFAGYEITRFLNSGGFCQIFEARHQVMDRRVAIKVEKEHVRADASRTKRILGEARALALLEHPHVVRILHADRDQRIGFFIVMELLEGRDLRRIMLGLSAGKGSVPVDRACGIALQIADALSAFHRVGVMHRDLKPENIFVSSSSEGHSVKLLDLGLAKLGGQESGEVSLHGTVQYMAPEQLHGERASHRTEVFALGVVLYELLAGVHPFPPAPGFKSRGVAAHVGMDRAAYQPLTDGRPDIPRALDGFVRRVLSRKPEARPGSMQQFRAELARALREGVIEDANPDATAPLLPKASGPDPDATSPLGHPAADHAPTSGADAPQTDLGPTIRMPIDLGPVATVELAALELLGKPPEERVLPPFACALRSELATPSLVLVEAPGAWRFMRIPVLSVPGVRRSSSSELGFGTSIPIPGLPGIALRSKGDRVFVEGPIEGVPAGSELRDYDTFRCGPYRFQFVPPTPDGLGIPVDYATRSAPYEELLDVESLLVQSGAVDAVMRKIPLRETTSFVGGGADVDVPLFGCELRVAARLTKVAATGNLKVARAEGAQVRLHGSWTPDGEIGVLDRLEIEGWEFVYLPGRSKG